MNIHDLDAFTTSYIETALWASIGANEQPLDQTHGPEALAPEALASIVEDCNAFQADNAPLIQSNPARAGHDFWLTRNHHGAGFWDGDWPEKDGKTLTEASHAFGSSDLYVGDNGLVYVS